MLYAYSDDNGFLCTVANDSTVSIVPDGAIEITEDQFHDRWSWQIVDEKLTNKPEPESTEKSKNE